LTLAPPLTNKRETPDELAAREQITVAAHQAHATPLTTLTPPPPRHAQRFPLLCRRVPTLGLTRIDGPGLARPAERLATTGEKLATSTPRASPDRMQLSNSADPSSQQQHPSWSERHLSHILKMNQSTMAPKPKRTGPYKYFVPMSIGGVCVCDLFIERKTPR
jgi:hypothetical protein